MSFCSRKLRLQNEGGKRNSPLTWVLFERQALMRRPGHNDKIDYAGLNGEGGPGKRPNVNGIVGPALWDFLSKASFSEVLRTG